MCVLACILYCLKGAILKQLKQRLSNIKAVKKRQGPSVQRKEEPGLQHMFHPLLEKN